MKVVVVVESFATGVLNVVLLSVRELVKNGCQVVVLHDIRPDTPPNVFSLFPASVGFVFFPIKKSLRSFGFLNEIFKFRKIICDAKPDVVHFHSSFAGAFGRLACLGLSNSSFYYSPHAFKFAENSILSPVFFALEWLLDKLRPGVIVACSKSEQLLARKISKSVEVLENAVSIPDSVPGKIIDSSVFDSKVLIGSVGRLAKQKNPELFSAIFARLKRIDNLSAVWVGGGEERYVALLNNVGVSTPGQVNGINLWSIFSEIDIYVQTSLYEGMPLSVIEAQLMGIPCVVSDVDGNRDVVEHGITGYIAKDMEEFCDYLIKLISDPSLRLVMGEEARRISLKRFSVEKFGRNLISIYTRGIDV